MSLGEALEAGRVVTLTLRPGAWVLADRRAELPVSLGPREQQALELMPWPLRRSEWLAGRRVAKALLEHTHSWPASRLEVLSRPSGAPAVLVDGVERSDLVLSLSHTRGWVAAAVASGPIGIDVCDLADGPRLKRIDRRVFGPGEAEGCDAHRTPARQAAVWALKEAVLKLRFGGVFEPGARSVRVESLEPPRIADGTPVVLYQVTSPDAVVAVAL